MLTVFDEVYRLGGAARLSTLRECGHTEHAVRRAVAHKLLVRPRKGWVADPHLDPELRFAARHGVVLSCVTLAKRRGLWIPEPPAQPHVATRSPGSHVSASAQVHWSRPIVPRHPDELLDTLPNMLHYVAKCLPHEAALTVWESALNKKMIDLEALSALPFDSAARRLLSECGPFSDSGLETMFKTRLGWLRIPIRAQIWVAGHRVDVLIGDGLIVQIDGKQHAGPQKTADNVHDAELRLLGYHVIRLSYAQVVHDWPSVQFIIQNAVARGLHRRAR